MTDPYVRHKLKKLAKALLLEKVEAEDSDGEVKTEYRKSELMKKAIAKNGQSGGRPARRV